jgi:hypothetical protein
LCVRVELDETQIGQATNYEYEVFEYPSLAFTAAGQPRGGDDRSAGR